MPQNTTEYQTILKNFPRELPKLETINGKKTPLLWDFTNGSIGWHTDNNVSNNSTTAVIAIRNNNYHTIFISEYPQVNGDKSVSIGTMPYQYEVPNPQELQKDINRISTIQTYNGDKYAFYMIFLPSYNNLSICKTTQQNNNICKNQFGSINFDDVPKYTSIQQYAINHDNRKTHYSNIKTDNDYYTPMVMPFVVPMAVG